MSDDRALPTLVEETSDDFSRSISMSLKDGETRHSLQRPFGDVPSGITTAGPSSAADRTDNGRKERPGQSLDRNADSQSSVRYVPHNNAFLQSNGSGADRTRHSSAGDLDKRYSNRSSNNTGNRSSNNSNSSRSSPKNHVSFSKQKHQPRSRSQSSLSSHDGLSNNTYHGSTENSRPPSYSRLQGTASRRSETTSRGQIARSNSSNPTVGEQKKKKILAGFCRTNSAHASSFTASSNHRNTGSSSNTRPFANSFAKGSVLKQLKSRSSMNEDDNRSVRQQGSAQTAVYRRYKLGDYVLLKCDLQQVNMYGFPPGEGDTYIERHGPYEYAVAKVRQVHFEEITVYYTLTLEYDGSDRRGDAELMHPIRSKTAEEAALRAAKEIRERDQRELLKHTSSFEEDDTKQQSTFMRVLRCMCSVLMWPFLAMYEIVVFLIVYPLYRVGRTAFLWLQRQARLLLNGMKPYRCTVRITCVNLIVLCCSWYMFIDQARLAFFPPDSDDILARINFVVWVILVCELAFEVFIRPDGYNQMIVSDKAFAPGTVRFISSLHLTFEIIALGFFVPEFLCIFTDSMCSSRETFSYFHASLIAVVGSTWQQTLAGRAFLACVRLRVFSLVRHWKNVWINTAFVQRTMEAFDGKPHPVLSDRSHDASTEVYAEYTDEETMKRRAEAVAAIQRERDHALINASNIGTALMVTNSYRALTIVCAIVGLFPFLSVIYPEGVANCTTTKMISQLQKTNALVTAETDDSCDFFVSSIESWVDSFAARNEELLSSGTSSFLLSLVIQPSRCALDLSNSASLTDEYVVTANMDCESLLATDRIEAQPGSCIHISLPADGSTLRTKAESWGIRYGAIQTVQSGSSTAALATQDGTVQQVVYAVKANFSQAYVIESSALLSFLLQLFLLILVLGGLTVLRGDAEMLVLNPLRSMLRIVARYAKNPLASTNAYTRRGSSGGDDSSSDGDDSASLDGETSEGITFSNYETEQLITAVSKITDLLRKCWGVAGADIISTNLATREGALTEVFNPTVPGRSVYALFAFAAIQGFDHAQKCLGGQVMSLINDVAAVLHGEVFRWGFGDSGQCNKNLGGAFLMVFRIGLVKEVIQKLKEATDVVFSTAGSKKIRKVSRTRTMEHSHHSSSGPIQSNTRTSQASLSSSFSSSFLTSSFHQFTNGRKSSTPVKGKVKNDSLTEAMKLSLQSLPGISTFTDRAVIGMLKSFAGIHRDKRLRQWSQDFRLSAGVGTYAVNMVFGMDAGWAVEGAVGSEYKIDATYLSPHVNMASRMMSACKHYGVTIMLSEAVQELMSDVAKTKLRNLDRVTVKGSTRVQKIFTYDARHKGANFFLMSREDEQADLEAERYNPNIWNRDQDLTAMRAHVTEDFENEYSVGLKAYYDGDWPFAIKKLERANDIMVEDALESAGMDAADDEEDDIRSEMVDGPCLYLINFMKSKGGLAPHGWAGWHPLLSK